MSNTPQTELLIWMEELTKYIDILALEKNQNNYYLIQHLSYLLVGVGERLNLEEIKNNYLVRSNLCSITKERLQRAIKNAGGTYEQLEQTGCLTKLSQKINTYLKETTQDIDFELDEKETELSGKMLYLAVTGKLNKDTYELTKRNSMAYGNYGVFIDKFLKLDSEHSLDPNNPWPHHDYISRELIDFTSGLFKLKNDQTFAVNLAIFNYLISKGYDPKSSAYNIATKIRETYNKHNPYVDIHTVQIEENLSVEFARRSLMDRNVFFTLVEFYKMCITSLPIELKSLLTRINIENERNPDDVMWRIDYTEDHNSGATCDHEKGIINSYQYENSSTEYRDTTIMNMFYILRHELGHAYDYQCAKEWGVETEFISQSKLWLEAMKLDQELSSYSSVSTYGANYPREDFADSIYYYLSGTNHLDNFPNRKRLLEENFKLKQYHPKIEDTNPKLS